MFLFLPSWFSLFPFLLFFWTRCPSIEPSCFVAYGGFGIYVLDKVGWGSGKDTPYFANRTEVGTWILKFWLGYRELASTRLSDLCHHISFPWPIRWRVIFRFRGGDILIFSENIWYYRFLSIIYSRVIQLVLLLYTKIFICYMYFIFDYHLIKYLVLNTIKWHFIERGTFKEHQVTSNHYNFQYISRSNKLKAYLKKDQFLIHI